MKSDSSNTWNASVQPRKQRKYNYKAPLHIKHKFLSANLSKLLRQKHGKRNLPLRKGDEVLVMRGIFKKKKAKITFIDLRNSRIALEGIQRTKKDGSKVNVYFHPSVLQIATLNLDDKKRSSIFERKSKKEEAKKENKKNASN